MVRYMSAPKQIKVANGVSLPIELLLNLEIITNTIAILAKRRAGKSYTIPPDLLNILLPIARGPLTSYSYEYL